LLRISATRALSSVGWNDCPPAYEEAKSYGAIDYQALVALLKNPQRTTTDASNNAISEI
jgi:hypothetical protein